MTIKSGPSTLMACTGMEYESTLSKLCSGPVMKPPQACAKDKKTNLFRTLNHLMKSRYSSYFCRQLKLKHNSLTHEKKH